MTIKEFKKMVDEFCKFNPQAQIFMASDAEGNSFHPIDEIAAVHEDPAANLVIWPQHEDLEEV